MLRIINFGKKTFKQKGWNYEKENVKFPAFWTANQTIGEDKKEVVKNTFISVGTAAKEAFPNGGWNYAMLKVVFNKQGRPVIGIKKQNEKDENTYALISFYTDVNEHIMDIRTDADIDVYFYGIFSHDTNDGKRNNKYRKQFIAIANMKSNPKNKIEVITENVKKQQQFSHVATADGEVKVTRLKEKLEKTAKALFTLTKADGTKVKPSLPKPKKIKAASMYGSAGRRPAGKKPFGKAAAKPTPRDGKWRTGKGTGKPFVKRDNVKPADSRYPQNKGVRVNNKQKNPGTGFNIAITNKANYRKVLDHFKGKVSVIAVDAEKKTIKGAHPNTNIFIDDSISMDKFLPVLKQLNRTDMTSIKMIKL